MSILKRTPCSKAVNLQGRSGPAIWTGASFWFCSSFLWNTGMPVSRSRFQVCRNGTAACGDENTIRHLIHKDTGDSIPRPSMTRNISVSGGNQFPVAFHAMMIISLHGGAKE